MKRRFLAWVLTVAMVIAMLPVSALAERYQLGDVPEEYFYTLDFAWEEYYFDPVDDCTTEDDEKILLLFAEDEEDEEIEPMVSPDFQVPVNQGDGYWVGDDFVLPPGGILYTINAEQGYWLGGHFFPGVGRYARFNLYINPYNDDMSLNSSRDFVDFHFYFPAYLNYVAFVDAPGWRVEAPMGFPIPFPGGVAVHVGCHGVMSAAPVGHFMSLIFEIDTDAIPASGRIGAFWDETASSIAEGVSMYVHQEIFPSFDGDFFFNFANASFEFRDGDPSIPILFGVAVVPQADVINQGASEQFYALPQGSNLPDDITFDWEATANIGGFAITVPGGTSNEWLTLSYTGLLTVGNLLPVGTVITVRATISNHPFPSLIGTAAQRTGTAYAVVAAQGSPPPPPPPSSTLTISQAFAVPGDVVTVQLYLSNNPGFAHMLMRLNFSEHLELVGYELGCPVFHTTVPADLIDGFEGPLGNDSFMGWALRDAPVTTSGRILSLHFNVLSAPMGVNFLPVSVVFENAIAGYEPPSDLYGNPLTIGIVNGGVNVGSFIVGDASGNGIVNSADSTLLARYLAGHNVTIDRRAVDLNGDGVVNEADVFYFRRWLLGRGLPPVLGGMPAHNS